jgi:hypothetical protein
MQFISLYLKQLILFICFFMIVQHIYCQEELSSNYIKSLHIKKIIEVIKKGGLDHLCESKVTEYDSLGNVISTSFFKDGEEKTVFIFAYEYDSLRRIKNKRAKFKSGEVEFTSRFVYNNTGEAKEYAETNAHIQIKNLYILQYNKKGQKVLKETELKIDSFIYKNGLLSEIRTKSKQSGDVTNTELFYYNKKGQLQKNVQRIAIYNYEYDKQNMIRKKTSTINQKKACTWIYRYEYF